MGDNGRLITRRRDKLACVECRRRKLRCDRATPCGACVRRGSRDSCTYESSTDASLHPEAEARLERLESLVTELIAGKEPHHESSSSDKSSQARTPQSNGSASDAATYNGPTHWAAISEEIQGLRTLFADEYMDAETHNSTNEAHGTDILFGSGHQTLASVLAFFLPPRAQVDSLVAAYFRASSVTAPFIHAAHFRRLYAEFWADTESASPLYASILFSICHISSNTLKTTPNKEPRGGQYSVAAAHCLAVGEYYRPRPLAVEALLLYAQAQCLTSQILPLSLAPVFGTLIRLATMMGYHRDPEALGFTLFEQEMRRRTWSLCMQLDLLSSFHFGLPSGVQAPTWDTKAPRNLLDTDFDENTTELPPSRPESEPTEIMFYIVKHRFMAVFERILRHSLSAESSSGDVQALDAELRHVLAATPKLLQPYNVSDSVFDSAAVIVTRLCVSFIYNKCLCVLHRRYVSQRREASIRACYNAATSLVSDFVAACHQLLPGEAESQKWFFSSLTWHDFLLGTMMLCLLLWADATSETPFLTSETPGILENLETAQGVLAEYGMQRAPETKRVEALVQKTRARFSGSSYEEFALQTDGSDMDALMWADLERFMDLDGPDGRMLM